MLTLERLGGGPMAEATESDGGTAGAGLAFAVEVGEFFAGVFETGGVDGGVGSRTTPTGASGAPSPPLGELLADSAGAIAVATESESGSAPGPVPSSNESMNAVGLGA